MPEEEKDEQPTNDEPTPTPSPTDDDGKLDKEPLGQYDWDEPAGDDDTIPSVPGDDAELEANEAPPADSDEKVADADTFEIDEALARRAQDLGLDAEDFASATSLERTVTKLEKQFTGKQKDEPVAADAEPSEDVDMFKVELDPDVYDDNLLKTLNAMNEHYAKQVGALKKDLTAVSSGWQQKQAQDFEKWFDKAVIDLGDDYTEVLGKGPGRNLSEGSTELNKRMELLTEMDMASQIIRQKTGKMPSWDELFERAVAVVLRDKSESLTRRKISRRVKRQPMTSRPTNRDATNSRTPRQDAEQFVSQFMRQHGVGEDPAREDFL